MKALTETQVGMFYAVAAYMIWGFSPLYFKYLADLPIYEMLSHRVIWSLLITALMIIFMGRYSVLKSILSQPKKLIFLAISSLLISCNWGVFVWAINNDRMLDASLGYFINPLINVLLGLVFLKESLSRLQWVAVSLALIGVSIQVIALGSLPWISLVLPFSFAFYGLLRKKIKVDALIGFFIETCFIAPVAIYYMFVVANSSTSNMLLNSFTLNSALIFAGVMTAFPLIFFTQAALRLALSTLGFFQYLAPTLLFVFAVVLYDEPLDILKISTFTFIWLGILVFIFEKQISRYCK
ncbi:transporter DMT superfamily protein [Psychromonas sp. CNPT3]|uniref:EamA family transporter RarD n=1 Tax=Psychromonas sp. CNPT3 TaxID=314282 RepID=UPI00006E484B|nr:EamA family transporter RarD [Psychromonas sp. CNPT3]AGH81822.1 transporter DMT superfamily protein [Psychromonas sp. CNPT3]